MEYTLEEIKKHKIKISNLSIQLINTNNIADEIMLNNEIKNETNYILSLLNIKINEIQLNNNIINNNNQNFNIITKQEILAHQQMTHSNKLEILLILDQQVYFQIIIKIYLKPL